MTFTAALRNAFSFRARQVTALALLLYTTVFVVLIVGNQLAAVPDDEAQRGLGLALEEAYEDLYTITARPHPYNSRENDRVRAHLLRRLNGIAQNHPFVHAVDDNTTSGFLDGSVVNYFQGNNVLVKVDGSEDQRNGDAILFSAHFDSVSTAPGATDDGMSVASLLQMVKYLANNRPRRTAIFNFNNGEEDGLHGAHSFIAHRWANITSTFVNFEGAGAGGRPFLFRANSLPILRAFSHSHIPHPHADAISADAFAMHVIRSETDYAVYAGPRSEPSFSGVKAADHGAYTGSGGGMRGADVAFIQHRSRYHTPEDSIRAMGHEGSRRALWASMETVRGAGAALLDAPEGGLSEDVVGDAEPATYFELFGTYLVAFPLRTLLAISISLLVAGPIVLLIIGFYLYRQTLTLNGRWIMGFRGYGRFWLAFLISAGFQIGLVVGYLKLNPYTVHAHSVSVVASILSLSYLGFSIPLTIAQYVRPIPPAKQKFTILLELYFFTWLLLIGATILAGAKNISGLYWVMTWNTSALVAALLVMVEGLVGRGHGGREIVAPAASEDEGAEHHAGEEAEEDVSEQTPLIGRRLTPAAPTSSAVMLDETIQDRSPLWWILQMLFSIPVPAYQIGSLMLLWIQSMSQTTPDGGWAGIIYIPLSLVSILILLPLTPYVHKMHGLLTALVAIVFVACTLHAWFTWPFDTSGSRLKVWFTSHVELANLTTSSTPSVSLAAFTPDFVRAKTELSVVPGFLDLVVNELPSSRSGNITPTNGIEERRKGLQTRGWTVTPRWHPSVDPEGRWLEASAVRVNTTTAHFTIRGENTRSCRLSTHNRSIRRFRARSHKERKWTEYVLSEVPEPGVRELRLWSRTWDDAFEVEVEFKEEDSGAIEGQVSCAWAEYSGGWAAGIGAQPDVGCSAGVRIPALEEVLAFMPEWTVVSKIEDGLVTADSGFVLE